MMMKMMVGKNMKKNLLMSGMAAPMLKTKWDIVTMT